MGGGGGEPTCSSESNGSAKTNVGRQKVPLFVLSQPADACNERFTLVESYHYLSSFN